MHEQARGRVPASVVPAKKKKKRQEYSSRRARRRRRKGKRREKARDQARRWQRRLLRSARAAPKIEWENRPYVHPPKHSVVRVERDGEAPRWGSIASNSRSKGELSVLFFDDNEVATVRYIFTSRVRAPDYLTWYKVGEDLRTDMWIYLAERLRECGIDSSRWYSCDVQESGWPRDDAWSKAVKLTMVAFVGRARRDGVSQAFLLHHLTTDFCAWQSRMFQNEDEGAVRLGRGDRTCLPRRRRRAPIPRFVVDDVVSLFFRKDARGGGRDENAIIAPEASRSCLPSRRRRSLRKLARGARGRRLPQGALSCGRHARAEFSRAASTDRRPHQPLRTRCPRTHPRRRRQRCVLGEFAATRASGRLPTPLRGTNFATVRDIVVGEEA